MASAKKTKKASAVTSPAAKATPDVPSTRDVAPAPGGDALLWSIIERVGAVADGDLDASCAAFAKELDSLEDSELVAVDAAFCAAMQRAYDYTLWTAAYLIHGGCSDDGFWDFRAGLIAMGREVYEAAVADPDTLAEIDDIEDRTLFEGFQYLPSKLVEARGITRVGRGHSKGKPTGKGFFGEDEAEVLWVLPRLHARFG